MKKIWNWLKESNRWQHLLVGALIGLTLPNIVLALYVTLLISVAVEYKDRQWGGKFDWIDISLGVAGGIVGSSITGMILLLC